MKIIWLADSTSPHVERWFAALRDLGIDIKIYSLVRRRPRVVYLFDLISILLRIRREPTSIVHAHFASSYGVISSFLPSRFLRVVSVWGSDILVTANLNSIYRLLVKRALSKADVRIANSQYLGSAASSILDLHYETIPFGLQLEEFPFEARYFSPIAGKPFVIGVAKRLHQVAGIDILLRAFAQTVHHLDDVDLVLHIAGDGPEEYRLKKLANELGINQRVKWSGWCDANDVRALYANVHLAVFPSRVEGLGVSTIEAMAVGAPVLAANKGGLVELVGKKQERGTLFDLDVDILAQNIADSVESYEFLLHKAKNARSYIEDEFDINANAVQLINIYKSLISTRDSKND